MIYRIYGQKDSTIYEQSARKTQNTGKDEILEVTKFFDELTNTDWIGNSRILTQFDYSDVSASIVNVFPFCKCIVTFAVVLIFHNHNIITTKIIVSLIITRFSLIIFIILFIFPGWKQNFCK